MIDVQVYAPCCVGGLFEEDGVAGEFCDVDGDAEALAGEDGVCEGDVLGGEGAGDGKDEDAGCEGLVVGGGCGVAGGAGGVCVCG